MREAKFSTAGPKRAIASAQQSLVALKSAIRQERDQRQIYADKLARPDIDQLDPRIKAGCLRGIEAADANIEILEKARAREREDIHQWEAMIASIEKAQAMSVVNVEVVYEEDDDGPEVGEGPDEVM